MAKIKTTATCGICEREYKDTKEHTAPYQATECESQGRPKPLEVGDVFSSHREPVNDLAKGCCILTNPKPIGLNSCHEPQLKFVRTALGISRDTSLRVGFYGKATYGGGTKLSDEEISDLARINTYFRKAYGDVINEHGQSYLDKPLSAFNWSIRAQNALRKVDDFQADIINGWISGTVRDLAGKTEGDLAKFRGCGRKAIEEIRDILKVRGLDFAEADK